MKIPSGINCIFSIDDLSLSTKEEVYNVEMNNKLKLTKEKIDDYADDWDKMKKLANPFELIHSSNIKEKKEKSIALYNPLSRSFFKLLEIIYKFDILSSKKDENIVMGGIAEGPGGFLEAFIEFRKKQNSKVRDNAIGITLWSNNKYVPNWNKINEKYKYNIKTLYGNLYEEDDINEYCNYFKNKKAYLVTADGGFDYSSNFNNQEVDSLKIILSEIITCFKIQEIGGTFVIKIFDLFTPLTLKLLYIIYYHYEEIYIYKPLTSRPANSEKYIVAKKFKGIHSDLLLQLEKILYTWKKKTVFNLNGLVINKDFYINLNMFNVQFVSNQLKYIEETLHLIKNKLTKEEYNSIIANQVSSALEWIKKHDLEINTNSRYYKNFTYYQKIYSASHTHRNT